MQWGDVGERRRVDATRFLRQIEEELPNYGTGAMGRSHGGCRFDENEPLLFPVPLHTTMVITKNQDLKKEIGIYRGGNKHAK
jgi:hypothetical protein